jgi:hypothetical protein
MVSVVEIVPLISVADAAPPLASAPAKANIRGVTELKRIIVLLNLATVRPGNNDPDNAVVTG